jgi:hypothetical protein
MRANSSDKPQVKSSCTCSSSSSSSIVNTFHALLSCCHQSCDVQLCPAHHLASLAVLTSTTQLFCLACFTRSTWNNPWGPTNTIPLIHNAHQQ